MGVKVIPESLQKRIRTRTMSLRLIYWRAQAPFRDRAGLVSPTEIMPRGG